MTHWKRVLFVAWLTGIVLLSGTWLGSRRMILEGQATVGNTELLLGIRGGSLQLGTMETYPRSGSSPRFQVGPALPEDAMQRNLRLEFIPVPFPDIRILNIPIWFLILLHTTFFALLYPLARRHYKNKATPPP